MMKNSIFVLIIFTFILFFFTFCKTTPPSKVKIIEEHDPVVKNLEEKDSIRIIHKDTAENITKKKP